MKKGKKEYYAIVDILNNNDNLVYDRCMLGECIYGPIIRNYYPKYMRSLEKEINKNTILVLVTANSDIVKKRFDGKFIKKEQIPKILNKFFYEFHKSNFKNKLMINTTLDNPKVCANKIIEYIERCENDSN